MPRLILTDQALEDLASVWSYIARDDPDAATRLIERIESATHRLEKYPWLGEVDPRVGEYRRRLIVGNYLVYYRVENESVIVLRVYHSARRIEDLFRDSHE